MSSSLLLSLVWLLLAVVLLLAPPEFEGPALYRLDARHAITGMDVVALLPAAAAVWGLLNSLLRRSNQQNAEPAGPLPWSFVAGLALGLSLAARFSYLAIHWPLAVGMLLLVIVGLFASGRS